jgi:hypothetical protein
VKKKAFLKSDILLLQACTALERGNLVKGDSLVQEAYDLCKDVDWGTTKMSWPAAHRL